MKNELLGVRLVPQRSTSKTSCLAQRKALTYSISSQLVFLRDCHFRPFFFPYREFLELRSTPRSAKCSLSEAHRADTEVTSDAPLHHRLR